FKIIDIELKALFTRIQGLGYTVNLTDGAKEFIAEKGFDSNFGARPLKRAIQKYLEDPIAEEILKGDLADGATLEIDYNKEKEEIVVNGSHKSDSKKSAKPTDIEKEQHEDEKDESNSK